MIKSNVMISSVGTVFYLKTTKLSGGGKDLLENDRLCRRGLLPVEDNGIGKGDKKERAPKKNKRGGTAAQADKSQN